MLVWMRFICSPTGIWAGPEHLVPAVFGDVLLRPRRGEDLADHPTNPAHSRDSGLRVIAELLGHSFRAPMAAVGTHGRRDGLAALTRAGSIEAPQYRREQGVSPRPRRCWGYLSSRIVSPLTGLPLDQDLAAAGAQQAGQQADGGGLLGPFGPSSAMVSRPPHADQGRSGDRRAIRPVQPDSADDQAALAGCCAISGSGSAAGMKSVLTDATACPSVIASPGRCPRGRSELYRSRS